MNFKFLCGVARAPVFQKVARITVNSCTKLCGFYRSDRHKVESANPGAKQQLTTAVLIHINCFRAQQAYARQEMIVVRGNLQLLAHFWIRKSAVPHGEIDVSGAIHRQPLTNTFNLLEESHIGRQSTQGTHL